MAILQEHIAGIIGLCKQYHVRALFAFGSAVRGHLKPTSDIDFVVDIDEEDPLTYADNYFNLKFQLEKLLNRPIDLLEQKAIKNPYLEQEINQTKMLLYGA